ncbi:Ppx/GppA family phosphatase [Ramlibacter sp. AN1015]|uniref:Ppx/GppA family phosphatase n=1 Tax=Ramlibacter sp. AN1015 TaxID=3133428 RepID=UPI0030BC6250
MHLVAIDLGSNSFRLEIGRSERGLIERVAYAKETVRLGGGLDSARRLTQPAMQRGLECLACFAERLQEFPQVRVRAVATQTLREARNRDEFLARAREVLGFPIEVLDGREEARLIYAGVAHLLPKSDERRLVVDIGGRSTELILGKGFEAALTDSLRVGSVSWSQQYFPTGAFTDAAFDRAEGAAKAVLAGAADRYRQQGWDQAYGASGTVGAVARVLSACGWPPGQITRESLQWLRARLLVDGHAERVRFDGLTDDLRPVIGGGLAVLLAVFVLFEIDAMEQAHGALRHGVLHQLAACPP